MSEWMKEMERLVDAHEIAISRRLNGAAWNEETDASRAALLAHAAQRDHIEGSLDMVQSVELPEAAGTFYLDESTAQWSEYKRPPSALTEGDSILYHEQALRTYGDAREAAGYARGLKEADKLREALRFYARGEHYMLDEADEFDTVSGEPDNLLFSGRDGCSTMVEDGSIAKAALAGEMKP